MVDVVLVILGFVCVVVGVFGSFLPILPGPPISWFGVLLVYFTTAIEMNYWVLGIGFVVAAATVILDYVIPARGTKHFGGSSYGVWGTNIGLVVGIFLPIPFGFIIGPFVGAFVGEIIFNNNHKRALKAATGSFIGFLASTFMKFVVCMGFLGLYFSLVWKYKSVLF